MDSARFQQWSQQEEHFHLKQARLRSKIRIKDGRAKAIDLLARYLDILEGNDAADWNGIDFSKKKYFFQYRFFILLSKDSSV